MNSASFTLPGLVAATFTPLKPNGDLDIAPIPSMVQWLHEQGIRGLYVLGSTGEGVSMTFAERCEAAASFVAAARGKMPVVIQVGCESLQQAGELAAHAQEVGADAISAVSPLYFKPDSVPCLVESMAQIAAQAPKLPFYYYHIPSVTGVGLNMLEFLRLGHDRIPTLRGIKYSSPNVPEYQACLEFAGGEFDILWGTDEMLLSALIVGAKGAVGSTYNYAAGVYHKLLQAFQAGDMEAARRWQAKSQAIVRAFVPYGPRAAQKAIMGMVGHDCGPARLPLVSLSPERSAALRADLEAVGFFE